MQLRNLIVIAGATFAILAPAAAAQIATSGPLTENSNGATLPQTHPMAPTSRKGLVKHATLKRVVAPMIHLPAASANPQNPCLLGVEDCR